MKKALSVAYDIVIAGTNLVNIPAAEENEKFAIAYYTDSTGVKSYEAEIKHISLDDIKGNPIFTYNNI